jgi:hypothetical protein
MIALQVYGYRMYSCLFPAGNLLWREAKRKRKVCFRQKFIKKPDFVKNRIIFLNLFILQVYTHVLLPVSCSLPETYFGMKRSGKEKCVSGRSYEKARFREKSGYLFESFHFASVHACTLACFLFPAGNLLWRETKRSEAEKKSVFPAEVMKKPDFVKNRALNQK